MRKGLLLLYYSITSLIISYGLIRDKLFKLNTIQLDRSGDGFKNYFTFAYHYQHGDGFWFEGMQYPYGDLILFADAQPIILFFLKCLKSLGLNISGHELFVLQVLPLLTLLVAAVILHKIMRSFGQGIFWTMLTVTFCIALSPQLFKFNTRFCKHDNTDSDGLVPSV